MTSAHGIHHLAISTADMKGQLEFFTQVIGAPLVAIFDMHGVEGAIHAFVALDESTHLAFSEVPGMGDVPIEMGVTHAGTGAGISAPGTMQHLSMLVADEDELLGLRDRLRDAGVIAMGPIDHGMCKSIYFGGPEGLTLEASCGEPIDHRPWVDPTAAAKSGISEDDLARYIDPPAYERPAEAVAQPGLDTGQPKIGYPDEVLAQMITVPDDVITQSASYADPPVDITT